MPRRFGGFQTSASSSVRPGRQCGVGRLLLLRLSRIREVLACDDDRDAGYDDGCDGDREQCVGYVAVFIVLVPAELDIAKIFADRLLCVVPHVGD